MYRCFISALPMLAAAIAASDTSAIAVSDTSGPSTRRTQELRTICRVRRHADDPEDSADVVVYLDAATNTRNLVFGVETIDGSETEVICEGDVKPGTCPDIGNAVFESVADCPACPCSGKPKQPRYGWGYMFELTTAVEKACSSFSTYNVLIVGLGGGSIARQIVGTCPNAQVHGVDYDERVIEAGQKYFGPPMSRLATYKSDATAAVQHLFEPRTFDAVLIDCFSAKEGVTPASCSSDAFVFGVKALLRTSTSFVGHYLWRSDARWPQLAVQFKEIERRYQDFYCSHIWQVPSGETTVIYGSKAPSLRGG